MSNYLFWLMGRGYGERQMRDAVLSASRHLGLVYPGARVAWMEINGRRPGRLWPHRSHGRGVDIDILYIGRRPNGELYPSSIAVFTFGYALNYGKDRRCGSMTFDAGANWVFLEGLYLNRSKKVKAIFVEPYIRQWLIEEGERRKADPAILDWARKHLKWAGKKAALHDDHFHVRFKTTPHFASGGN